ncbi:MAG: hypothetical protein WCK73_14235 [Deltaproteobacteria bacterium]
MKKIVRVLAACAIALFAQGAWATPSTLFWTPATTYVQPYLIPHITYDTYFNDKANYPMDLGLTMGILPWEKIQAEVGIDAFLPYWGAQNAAFLSPAGALQFNAKVGLTEGAFGEWFPGISLGIYGVGTNQATQFDILHAEIGKGFFFGTLTVGGYYGAGGSDLIWSDWSNPDAPVTLGRAGFIGSYISPDIELGLKGLNKINFFADIQTGNNAYSAAAAGIGIYFTPSIDILTGPVFFLNKYSQPGFSNMMWSVQLDIDIDFGQAPKAPAPAEPAKS